MLPVDTNASGLVAWPPPDGSLSLPVTLGFPKGDIVRMSGSSCSTSSGTGLDGILSIPCSANISYGLDHGQNECSARTGVFQAGCFYNRQHMR